MGSTHTLDRTLITVSSLAQQIPLTRPICVRAPTLSDDYHHRTRFYRSDLVVNIEIQVDQSRRAEDQVGQARRNGRIRGQGGDRGRRRVYWGSQGESKGVEREVVWTVGGYGERARVEGYNHITVAGRTEERYELPRATASSVKLMKWQRPAHSIPT